MDNIIIVECFSSGKNFIKDIVRRNYNPIVLEEKLKGVTEEFIEEKTKLYNSEYAAIDEDFELIYEQDTFEETLEMVKKFNPILILPGSEEGVVLATKLSNELGLISTPNESLDAMTLKDEMQNALQRAGIRYIKGKTVNSLEEAVKFYKYSGLKEVVVKPLHNSGSVGVTICSNEEELRQAIESTLGFEGFFGEIINEVVIQERIKGEEYIVNTVSHKGVHRVTTIWKYYKKQTKEGNYIYDYMDSVNELDISHAEMVEYAYKVADAIGIKYGPVHGEYMIDEKGPVLIEVNCRPCGGSMDAEFLDKLSGQHETDSILDSYLNPERFNYERMKKYRLQSYGGLKFFIIPKDIFPQSIPMEHIGKQLKSHYKTVPIDLTDGPHLLEKTKDLETAGGVIYLNHEDYHTIQKDLNYLRSVESLAFSQVISDGSDKKTTKEDSYNPDIITDLLTKNTIKGTTLLITDEYIDNPDIVQCKLNNLDEVCDNFENVFLNLDESILNIKDSQTTNLILNIKDKIKVGGIILIPKKTYQYIAGGRNGMEALVKALNLRIEVPPYGINDIIIATRT
jgi:D-alanine-D-alanine ligase-like ATP-grasp enzyme